jgi:Uma2 family endonuclease
MIASTAAQATLDDLYKEEGKAELIGGRIVRFMASGFRPSRVAGKIFNRLTAYEESTRQGYAFGDGIGYTVPQLSSGRESFSPDASYYMGDAPVNEMRFIEGVPLFAVEVRSENDYGNAAEREMTAKRTDYFAAGTLIVWDVDPEAETVTSYHTTTPTQPTIFRRGDVADAESAIPGWRVKVDDLFTR